MTFFNAYEPSEYDARLFIELTNTLFTRHYCAHKECQGKYTPAITGLTLPIWQRLYKRGFNGRAVCRDHAALTRAEHHWYHGKGRGFWKR